MTTKEKSTPEKEAPANRNMALAKPVPRVAPKKRRTAAPSPPIKSRETATKK